jgi:hypothetical protein
MFCCGRESFLFTFLFVPYGSERSLRGPLKKQFCGEDEHPLKFFYTLYRQEIKKHKKKFRKKPQFF